MDYELQGNPEYLVSSTLEKVGNCQVNCSSNSICGIIDHCGVYVIGEK